MQSRQAQVSHMQFICYRKTGWCPCFMTVVIEYQVTHPQPHPLSLSTYHSSFTFTSSPP